VPSGRGGVGLVCQDALDPPYNGRSRIMQEGDVV